LSVGPAQAIASMPEGIPQRFRFEVDVTFTTDGPGSYPAFAGVTLESPASVTVEVSFTSHLTWTAPAFDRELVVAPDPYIQNGPVSYHRPFGIIEILFLRTAVGSCPRSRTSLNPGKPGPRPRAQIELMAPPSTGIIAPVM
jgi:hypothetical protein